MTFLLISGGVLSLCGEGCLKCNDLNQCVLCDYTKGYQLSNQSCITKTLDNCETYSVDGLCLVCKPNFFLSQTQTTSCVAVTTPLTNCSYYSGPSTCRACSSGYYINGAICDVVKTIISNCQEYSGPSSCITCNPGYLPNVENNSCRQYTVANNCRRTSNINCLACDNTTFYQEDYVAQNVKFFMSEDPTGALSFNSYVL